MRNACVSLLVVLSLAGCGSRPARTTGDSATTVASPAPSPRSVATTDTLIHVERPAAGDLVTSPLVIAGEARGFWYFEADFPARLLDADGREIAVRPVRARGEWMTLAFVPFADTLRFTAPATATGVLVLEKS